MPKYKKFLRTKTSFTIPTTDRLSLYESNRSYYDKARDRKKKIFKEQADEKVQNILEKYDTSDQYHYPTKDAGEQSGDKPEKKSALLEILNERKKLVESKFISTSNSEPAGEWMMAPTNTGSDAKKRLTLSPTSESSDEDERSVPKRLYDAVHKELSTLKKMSKLDREVMKERLRLVEDHLNDKNEAHIQLQEKYSDLEKKYNEIDSLNIRLQDKNLKLQDKFMAQMIVLDDDVRAVATTIGTSLHEAASPTCLITLGSEQYPMEDWKRIEAQCKHSMFVKELALLFWGNDLKIRSISGKGKNENGAEMECLAPEKIATIRDLYVQRLIKKGYTNEGAVESARTVNRYISEKIADLRKGEKNRLSKTGQLKMHQETANQEPSSD